MAALRLGGAEGEGMRRQKPLLGNDLLGSPTTVAENILECGSSSYRLSDFGLAHLPYEPKIGRR